MLDVEKGVKQTIYIVVRHEVQNRTLDACRDSRTSLKESPVNRALRAFRRKMNLCF